MTKPTPTSAADPRAHAPAHTPAMSEHDVYLFNEGTHFRLYDRLGAHLTERDGVKGTLFSVWAPDARYVAVVGNFNNWDAGTHPMNAIAQSGVWQVFIPGIGPGEVYKYHVASRHRHYAVNKMDPFGFTHEIAPATASIVASLDYEWNDSEWMRTRGSRQGKNSPVSIYELHLGSWRRNTIEGNRSLTYRELAKELPEYLLERGFTHVEMLPIMEHPLFRSWGYQTTGYFAPTSRFGSPQDCMHLIDALHQAGIGVILDWVPSHFPSDEHALGYFDGTHLYEHADPRLGFHPDWKSLIFNYGRHEVRSFLISSALFWLDKYHADGIRVDAVASMLYLDYSRNEGEWIPNKNGGRENLEAVDFLQRLNTEIYNNHPGVETYAEESTAWPGVTTPVEKGGLGFGFKWDMGWMHDTLKHFERDPIHRQHHHHELTFRGIYMHSERYALPLSHDEVVHGKGSLIAKMPGDDWQRFANLRLLLTQQWTQPGKKLLFMGCEFAQHGEWNEEASLDWHLLQYEPHLGIQKLIDRLNKLYRELPGLHEMDCEPDGFRWIDADNEEESVLSYIRLSRTPGEEVVVLLNTTPVPRHGVVLGVPSAGPWYEVLSTDEERFGGTGVMNEGPMKTTAEPVHDQPHRMSVTAPPLGASLFVSQKADRG